MKCRKCGRKIEESELNAVKVYDNKRKFKHATCGTCATKNRVYRKLKGADMGKRKILHPWDVCVGVLTGEDDDIDI